MKIRTDVSESVYQAPKSFRQGRTIEAKASPERGSASIDSQLVQSISSRLNAERSLGEALSIAQASQSLLQKALIISSQLRNMAVQAATTGKISSSDLGNVLSEINSSFSSYNKGVVSPVSTYSVPAPDLPDLPGIKPELDRVADVAQSMQNGAAPDRKRIDDIGKSIMQKSSLYDSYIKAASNAMQDIGKSYDEGTRPGMEVYRISRDLIAGNPGLAMTAQGNVSPQDVIRIFTS